MKQAKRDYTKVVNLWLREEHVKKLKEEAAAEERSLSQTVRRIIRLYFAAKEQTGVAPCPKNPTP